MFTGHIRHLRLDSILRTANTLYSVYAIVNANKRLFYGVVLKSLLTRTARQELAVDLTPTRGHNFETRLIRSS